MECSPLANAARDRGGWPLAALLAALVAQAVVTPARADVAIPVAVQQARLQDVPVYATGLGTVAPLNTALIRPRVDGTLDRVAFTEGQEVHRGDLLAVIDPRPYLAVLDQARARRAQDAAALANARRDLQRYTALQKSGFASSQSADTQAAAVLSGQALIAADDAMIEAAALNVAFTRITSPIEGRAGLRRLDPGNLVHATDATGIVTITQMQPIGVLFTLPEQDLGTIGAAGAAPVAAFDSASGQTLATGTLLTADNQVSTATGTIQLKAVFANADGRLWPGLFVQARLTLRTLPRAVTVPARAVQRGPDGLYVYVMDATGAARARTVTEAQEQDGTAVIASGLQGGETVVTDGQSRVVAGAKLAPQPGAG